MKFVALLLLAFLVYCSDNKAKSVGNSLVQGPDFAVRIKPVEKDTVIVQTRLYKDLSYINNYKLTYSTYFKNTKPEHCCRSIEVFDKVNEKRKDSISLEIPAFMSYGEDINETRSYITGKNKNKQMVDNYAGDFIVVDLNFDGKEDFALPSESGASVGPYSTFFVQGVDGKFKRDTFLTDSVRFFPNKIFPKKRMLLTLVHANVYSVGEHKYVLNDKNQWHQVSHRFLGQR